MPFVPVPSTVMVEMRMRLDAQEIENTLYFEKATAWTVAQYTALANAMIVWWNTAYGLVLSSDLSLVEVYITDLTTATSPVHAQAAPIPNPTGTVPTATLPNNVSLTVSFRTANRGRSYRGRNYVPGLPENAVTLNTVQPSTVAGIQNAYTGLFAVADGQSIEWVVVSRYSGIDGDGKPIPRTIGLATPVTAAIVVDAIVDSQRRRLPKRGR